MSEKIVQLNEEVIKGQLKELVRGSVEETLNALLEQEAEKLTQAARYERNEARQGYRSGHYSRTLTTTSGDVTLHVPRLKGVSFETAIIERYRRRESSVEEALIEMYLAGVSVRRVEDITEALWGSKVSPATISELNKKAYVHIEDWRNRPLQGGRYPYVYVDGIYLRRNWGGEYENVAVLVAIAVNEDGYREVLGAAEGMKEDKASWVSFFQWLRGRGLDGVKLVVGDKCLGMLEAVGEVFPEAKYQRCTVHFYRNVFSVTPRSKVKLVAKMLKAIHAQESKKAAREKAKVVVVQLREMKLKEAAKKVEDGIEETLTYCDFPSEHWTRIRTNNVIERLNREIRRRTRVVGCFPDGNSALMLVCARLRHVAGTQWGNKRREQMEASLPWFEKAFSGGMILAGRNYCHYYEHGRGDLIPPEPEKEVPIMCRGAELGYPEWMYAYAHYLHYTEEKDKEALSWALKAAEAGHLWSWHIVGDLYWDGKDVEHNQSYSIECYEKTAGYGNDSYACRQLGRMYFNGWGTAVDYAGRSSGWSGMRNRNGSSMICWGSAICWGTGASRTRRGEKRTLRKARTRPIKTMAWG